MFCCRYNSGDELRVRFTDHTGELNARLPIKTLEDTLGYSVRAYLISYRTAFIDFIQPVTKVLGKNFSYFLQCEQLKTMSTDDRAAVRWKILLEQCTAKLAASTSRLIVLTLRRASPADPIPLY